MENSVKTSDEILNELFESIKPNEDNEASEASVSLSEGEEASSHKKSKKSKKEKKSKKKKKEKKKKRSPEPRKSRPLSPPVQDRSRRDHAHESGSRAYEHQHRDRDQHEHRGGHDKDHRGHDYHDQRERRSSDHHDQRERRSSDHHDHRLERSSDHYDHRAERSHDHRVERQHDHRGGHDHHDQRDRRSHDHYDHRERRSNDHYDHHDRRDGQDPRDREYGQRGRSHGQRGGRDEQRPPKRSSHGHHEDPFWDNRWDALQMQKKAEEMEKRGRHFLDDTRKRDLQRPSTSGTKRRKSRSPTPDTEELKRLKKMKQIQDLVVKEEDKYVAEPLDPDLFQWDDKVKMWKRKSDKSEKSYEEELKERMEEQFKEGKRQCDENEENEEKEPKSPKSPKEEEIKSPKEEPKEKSLESKDEKPEKEKELEKEPKKVQKKIDQTKMSLDEIEEIRKKREKFKKEKEKKDDKEEGEIDEDAEKSSKRNYRKHREEDTRDRNDRDRSSRSRHHEKPRRSRSRSRDRNRRSRSRDRSRRSRSRDLRDRNRRSRSRDRYRRSRSRDDRYYTNFRSSRDGRNYRSSDRYGSRSSRARSRSPKNKFRGSRTEIDKAKLLAIAKKNAVKLLSSDNLMGMDHEQLIAIKSGGQNLRQLTDFCRELAAKGITDEFDDDDDILYGNLDDFHHPFEVKDKPLPNPYTSSGIYDEKLTPAMKKAAMSHRMIEYPVSSGNAHRVKEADVVEEPPKKAIETEIPNAIEDKSEKSELPEPEPEMSEAAKINANNPLAVIMFGGVPEPPKELEAPKDPIQIPDIPIPRESRSQTPKESGAVFDDIAEPSKDISSIVSERLTAMKRLSENPQDPQALKQLYEAQKEMSNWAESKNKPGQFTGHTGAKILTHAELSMGVQAWARQEQFTKAQKVQGGFGEYLLKKMGWSEGEGLGKTRSGDVDPLTLDIKMDKKGFMAAEEDLKKRRRDAGGAEGSLTLTACKDLSHKHPVSGLMELSTKRKWGPPNFVQIFDCGPAHKKQYIFKVTVNGEDFQPTIASENKKKAKADAATVALQEMGLLPKDPNNPL